MRLASLLLYSVHSSTVVWDGNGPWLVCTHIELVLPYADHTQWWCAIGIGIAFIFCLVLMEETNYDRHTTPLSFSNPQVIVESADQPELSDSEKATAKDGVQIKDSALSNEKRSSGDQHSPDVPLAELGHVAYPRKTYWQKLSVIDKRRPNRMLDIMWAPFKFFTFPVVVWAGFM